MRNLRTFEENKEIDPFSEENWDEDIKGYLILYKTKRTMNKVQVRWFIESNGPKIYSTLEEAISELNNLQSKPYHGIYVLYNSGEIERKY